jgi:hypothetical protein
MTIKLTLDEKETIIDFDEGGPMVNVFNYDRRWRGRMKEMGIEPIRTEGEAKATSETAWANPYLALYG